MPWDKVHEEANRLEHSGSDELINRLEEMLEFPEYDPHGDPIPSKEGKVPKLRKHVQLADLKSGQTGTVIRVNDFDEQFLSYISRIGIKLGGLILVKEKRKFDKSLQIIVKGKQINISSKVAENIFVELKRK
jgi:DtxR family Mn-dependent transcriptional regulator